MGGNIKLYSSSLEYLDLSDLGKCFYFSSINCPKLHTMKTSFDGCYRKLFYISDLNNESFPEGIYRYGDVKEYLHCRDYSGDFVQIDVQCLSSDCTIELRNA